jgi:indolepyruvate ferredoxin oxidoreductase
MIKAGNPDDDEYEVARLYTDGSFFQRALARQFEGDYTLTFHLAPPLVAKRDAATGHLRKQELGPAMMKAFTLLAQLRRLRGTCLDVFGSSAERRLERLDGAPQVV